MATALEHDSVAYGTERDEWQEETSRCKSGVCLTVIVFGATGDLAAKKTFKSLATLYNKGCALVSGWTALHSATARPRAELISILRALVHLVRRLSYVRASKIERAALYTTDCAAMMIQTCSRRFLHAGQSCTLT